MKNFISIIIPAYNEEHFLNECLSSIFLQKTAHQFEVIVVDNNSRDLTKNIAAKWNVKYILENKPGATVTRNTGAKAAQGDILYFLDADCRIPPGTVDTIYKSFQNPSVKLLSGPYIYDQDGFLPKLFTDTLHYFSVYHAIFRLFTGVSQFPGGNFVIRKNLFEQVGGFDETINNQEIILPDDLDLAMRLHAMGVKALFSRTYFVFSSFRRVARSPIRDTWVRFFATLSMLRQSAR